MRRWLLKGLNKIKKEKNKIKEGKNSLMKLISVSIYQQRNM